MIGFFFVQSRFGQSHTLFTNMIANSEMNFSTSQRTSHRSSEYCTEKSAEIDCTADELHPFSKLRDQAKNSFS